MKHRAQRRVTDYPVQISSCSGRRLRATVIDVGEQGLKIKMAEEIRPGQRLALRVGESNLSGAVVWARSGTVGVRLDLPIRERERAILSRTAVGQYHGSGRGPTYSSTTFREL